MVAPAFSGFPLPGGPIRTRSGALGPPLMIALALLFLLGLLAVAQMQLSSQSLHIAAWDAGGAVAENVAVSAIEEAAWRLNDLFADHTAKDFNDLRLAIVAKSPSHLDLSRRLHPALLEKRLATAPDRPLYRTVRLDRFSAVLTVPPTGQFVDFDTVVTLSVAGHTIYRRAVERRLYGATFISPRKPWDRTTLAILKHWGVPKVKPKVLMLQTALEDTNRLIEVVNSIVPAPGSCDADCGPLLPGTTLPGSFIRLGKAPALPSEQHAQVERLLQEEPALEKRLADLDPESRSWSLWSLAKMARGKEIPIPEAPCCTQPQLPRLDPVPPRLVFTKLPSTMRVTSTTTTVELAKFDYEVRLRDEYQPHLRRLEDVIVPLNEKLLQWMLNPPTTAAERSALASTLRASLKVLPELFKAASKRLNAITRHAEAHTRLNVPPEALIRPTGLIPMAYHLEKQSHFDTFRKSYPLFSGHLSYVGPSPLFASLTKFSGLTIFSQEYLRKRPLVLRELSLKRSSHDLLIVHTDRMTIADSEIQAGLYVGGGRSRLYLDVEPLIRGNLVMEILFELAGRTPEEELRGKVVYNPALASGGPRQGMKEAKPPKMPVPGSPEWKRVIPSLIALDHIALALRPRGRERALFRSPGAFAAALGKEPAP